MSVSMTVVNGDIRDAPIRPNQAMAVSLAHPIVDEERGRKVLRAIQKHLLTPSAYVASHL
jgi:glycogen debranching enzyme